MQKILKLTCKCKVIEEVLIAAVAPEDAEAVVPVLVPVPAQAAVVPAVARRIHTQ